MDNLIHLRSQAQLVEVVVLERTFHNTHNLRTFLLVDKVVVPGSTAEERVLYDTFVRTRNRRRSIHDTVPIHHTCTIHTRLSSDRNTHRKDLVVGSHSLHTAIARSIHTWGSVVVCNQHLCHNLSGRNGFAREHE